MHALYAAARTADDLVDHPGADPAGDLADWSRSVLAYEAVRKVTGWDAGYPAEAALPPETLQPEPQP